MSEITGGELLLTQPSRRGRPRYLGDPRRHLHDLSRGARTPRSGAWDAAVRAGARGRRSARCGRDDPRHGQARGCDGVRRPRCGQPDLGRALRAGRGQPRRRHHHHRRSDIAYPHMGAMQVLDQHAYFKPAVKWSAHVDQWKRIPDAVRHAFRVAMTGRPGPVHIEFPEDLLLQRGDPEQAPVWHSFRERRGRVRREPGARSARRRDAPGRRASSHPLRRRQPSAPAPGTRRGRLPSTWAVPSRPAPVRGASCPMDTRWSLQPVSPASAVAKNMADVVLAVGTRFGELDFWGRPPVWREAGQQKVVQIDADPQNIGLNRPAEIALVGDAKVVLGQLLECRPRDVAARARRTSRSQS